MPDQKLIEETRRRREELMAAQKAGDTAKVQEISKINQAARTTLPANVEPARPAPAPEDSRAQALWAAQNREQQNVPNRQEPTIATAENPLVRYNAETSVKPQNDQQMLETIALKQYKNQPLNDDEIKFALNRELSSRDQGVMAENRDHAMELINQGVKVNGIKINPKDFQPMSVEEFLSLSPQQQAIVQSQLGFQGAQQAADIQTQGLNEQEKVIQDRINKEEERIAAEKTAAEGENAALLDEFKKQRAESDQAAIDELNAAGTEEAQRIKSVFAGRGSSRQTATMTALQKSSDNTKRRIADIERASGAAVSEYQVKLLDRMDQKMEKLQARLDSAYDVKDDFKLKRIQAETQLATDLWSQNPQNPQKMMEIAQKISETQIEEKKALKDSIAKNFDFMVSNFGSSWIKQLSPEGLQNYADNLDIPVEALQNIGLTKEEQNLEWDKLKYVGTQQFDLQKMLLGNQFDQQNRMLDFNNKLQELGITHQFDVELLERKNAFDVDLVNLKEALGDTKALGSWGGIIDKLGGASGYGGVAMGGDPSALSFDNPITHPAVNIPVTSLNVALAQAYPDGFKFKAADGAGGMGGQCKWYSELLTTLNGKKWSIGSTSAETKKNLANYVKKGDAFYPGQDQAKVGNTIITSDSPSTWHSAVINAITSDGKYVLTEANYKGPLTVTNSRIVSPNDPKIQGILRTAPASKYQVPEKILGGIKSAAEGGGIDKLLSKVTQIPNVLKVLQGGAEGKINNAINAGKAEMDVMNEAANDPVKIIQNDPMLSSIASGAYKPTNEEINLLARKAPQVLQYVNKAVEMGKAREQASKGFTQDQSNAALFGARMQQAEDIFQKLEDKGVNFSDKKYIGERAAPTDIFGISLGGAGKSDELKQQEQAERNFINAVLRRESGSAIAPSEYESAAKQYFPLPGDTPEVLQQKKENRQLAIQGIKASAGNASNAYFGNQDQISNDSIDNWLNS